MDYISEIRMLAQEGLRRDPTYKIFGANYHKWQFGEPADIGKRCTMNSILMCRGAAAGEVFVVDFDYLFQLQSEPYCCGKFEDWIIKTMKNSLGL